LSFDHAVWATTADRLRLDEDDGEGYVTIEAAAKARAARVEDAKRVNPKFNASAAQMRGSPGTTALYLATLWDEEGKGVPKRWVKAWMGESFFAFHSSFLSPSCCSTYQGVDGTNVTQAWREFHISKGLCVRLFRKQGKRSRTCLTVLLR